MVANVKLIVGEGSIERIKKQEVQKGSKPKDKKIRKQGNIT